MLHTFKMRGCPTITRDRTYSRVGECGTLWRTLRLVSICFCSIFAVQYRNEDIVKTFHYTAKEYIPADQGDCIYDTTIYTVDVTVGSENMEMTFDVKINDGDKSELVFVNQIVNRCQLTVNR